MNSTNRCRVGMQLKIPVWWMALKFQFQWNSGSLERKKRFKDQWLSCCHRKSKNKWCRLNKTTRPTSFAQRRQNEALKCPIYALKVYTCHWSSAGLRPDSRRARDEKQPEVVKAVVTEKSKETKARGTDTGSRSTTKEIKSGRTAGLTHEKQ